RILLSHGADPNVQTEKGETPLSVCTDSNIRQLLGGSALPQVSESNSSNFIPNYIRNAPLNGQVEIGPRRRLHHAEIASMPSTN
ncbi:hypothetical protein NL500_30175, partial [Klebsiella pneumoniae]|nr:hypothetical protein [Klebsiella pneumoniae]